jgi:Recombination endonuclease VII
MTEIECIHCYQMKPETDYYSRTNYKNKQPYLAQPCKLCSNAKSRKFNAIYRVRARDYWLRKKFGITLEQYRLLVAKHDGKCWICNKEHERLCVDHDHDVIGEEGVRGILCPPCNAALGALGDNAEGVRKALEYLEAYESNRSLPATFEGPESKCRPSPRP